MLGPGSAPAAAVGVAGGLTGVGLAALAGAGVLAGASTAATTAVGCSGSRSWSSCPPLLQPPTIHPAVRHTATLIALRTTGSPQAPAIPSVHGCGVATARQCDLPSRNSTTLTA